MNTLLIYPKYPDTFWSFKHTLKFLKKKAAFPPLGLLTIASMLPEDWNKKLVDINIEILRDEQIKWADIVFISAMIVQKDSAKEIIKRCKEQNKTVVVGGPFFTISNDEFPGVDHFILNEAEITLPMFLKDLKENKTLKKIYTSEEKPDITKTPLPMWSLININDYVTMSVQYSRGCPFNCEFCDIIVMNGRIPRTKTPEQMINEFRALYDAGWKGSIFIVDDNFIGNKLKVRQMLVKIIEWQKEKNYPFKLLTEASTNLADDDELMNLMSQANFHKVFLGIETPNPNSLKECGKVQNIAKDLKDVVKKIQNHGMQVMAGFIVGFDNDNEYTFDNQIKFIRETGIVTAMVGMLNAVPKTRLWNRLKSEGRLLKDSTGENTDGSINFVTKMDMPALKKGYEKIISTIYSRKEYYKRIDTFIKFYRPTVKGKLQTVDRNAFLRSLWKIGILSKARLRYWKLITKTILVKRKAFPVAIELAILGEHFEKITKKVLNRSAEV